MKNKKTFSHDDFENLLNEVDSRVVDLCKSTTNDPIVAACEYKKATSLVIITHCLLDIRDELKNINETLKGKNEKA